MIVRMPFFIRSGGNTNTSLPLMWYISTWPKYTTLCDYTLQVSTWLGFRHISNFSDFRSVSPFGWRHIAICDFVRQEGVGSSGFPSQETILTFNKTVVVYLSVLFRCQKFCQWLCKLLAKCGALPDVVQAIYCKHCQMWLNGPTQQEPQCDFDCSHVAVLVRNALKE